MHFQNFSNKFLENVPKSFEVINFLSKVNKIVQKCQCFFRRLGRSHFKENFKTCRIVKFTDTSSTSESRGLANFGKTCRLLQTYVNSGVILTPGRRPRPKLQWHLGPSNQYSTNDQERGNREIDLVSR